MQDIFKGKTGDQNKYGGYMTAKPVHHKNHHFGFPLKTTLTEDGIRFLIRNNKKLSKIRTADSQLEYGCLLENMPAEHLKKMIRHNYISKIEINAARLNARRREISEITESILGELLIQKFNETVYRKILSTPFIKNWNRINPTKCIDEKTRFNAAYLAEIVMKNERIISDIRSALLNSCMFRIQKDTTLSIKEIGSRLLIIDKFINCIKNDIWHLVLKLKSTGDYYSVISFINVTVSEYVEKSKASDYFNLIILELITSAENTRIEKFMKRHYRNADLGEMLKNRQLRESILMRMEEKKENIHLIWKIKNKAGSIGNEYRLKVMILNREYDYKMLKEEIEIRKNLPVNEKGLFDLYTENSGNPSNENLGLAYLSCLDDACRKLNIKFESFVNQIIMDDLPLISLSLNFK